MNNRKILLTAFALIACSIAYSQEGDFPFGKILNAELDMKNYAADTSAGAVVLKEFGRAWITDDYKVLFEYHAKIKILKKTGLKKGNFEIPLLKMRKPAMSRNACFPWKQLPLTAMKVRLRKRLSTRRTCL
jgi:hypothetical protein